MKRILTIQDISCVGKCSLTVALPVLSAAGLETCVLPTAVLSCHTGFSSFTLHDLTPDIAGIERSWEKEHFSFDAVYTGYLSSAEQVSLVQDIVKRFLRPGGLFLVDPAMADHGKLYPGFDMQFAHTLGGLCRSADVAVPNLTEAAMILNQPYRDSGYERSYIQGLLKGLTDMGSRAAVITGVSFDEEHLGVMAYDSSTDEFYEHYTKKIEQSFHGTGDLFASSVTASLMRGKNLQDALRVATEFTLASIEKTRADSNPNWYGVNFEEAIPYFLELLNE